MEINKSNYGSRPMDDHRTYNFLRALNDIKGKENKWAVDLGCGHCKFSDIASIFFDKVYAVDSRNVRLPDHLPENVEFIKGNAVDHVLEKYDVIICLGILYHLTAKEQMTILKKALGKEIIIDTHMATVCHNEVVSEGYKGSHYKEADSFIQMMDNPKASTTTLQSFWFQETEFERMLLDIGFTRIIKYVPEHYPNRTFMLIK